MATISASTPNLLWQDTRQIFVLSQDPITIGRKTGNTVVLPPDDTKASRFHATISWVDGRYVLEDMHSTNGTYVNSQRITGPRRLADGDVIGIGDSTFIINLPAPDTRPSISLPPLAPAAPLPVAPDVTIIRAAQPDRVENPYVGPRTFTREEADRFFGRETEARELLSLVISERLVLFYAQSGAGKSSLINTRLIPQLQDEGHSVLPVGRVSGELPEGVADVANIYIFNLLLSMDESDSDPSHFTDMRLTQFLAGLTSLDGVHYFYDHDITDTPELADEEIQESPYVLLIDQFEEVVATHPSRWHDREGFFEQLAEAMAADPYLWVVLSLREDYVAALDPYAHLLPGNLRARFYMQRMTYDAALEAIKRPAEKFGRTFAPGAAENLADNLRQIRVHDAMTTDMIATRLGQFVEPVQLQVVCFQLWDNLRGRPKGIITQQDLRELGDVDRALIQFYEQAIGDVTAKTFVSELDLRNWFEHQLITESGTKGTVYRGPDHTGGIDNRAVDVLLRKFLLRSEVRGGGTWYELVHDRLIEPILSSNQSWREQQPLIQMARTWDETGRPEASLLAGQQLKDYLATGYLELGPLVREFLEASSAAQHLREEREAEEELRRVQELAAERQKRLEEQARASARLRRRALWITVVGIVAVLMAVTAVAFGFLAQQSLAVAQERASAAETAQALSIAAQSTAVNAQSTADTSKGTAVAESTLSAEARSTAEAGSTAAAANAAEAKRLLELQQATQTAEAEFSSLAQESLAATRAALEATVTAQAATLAAPTFTPTATATPTYTPSGSDSQSATPESPTATPAATDTPTPDAAATANVEKLIAISTQQASLTVQQTAEVSCKVPTGADLQPYYVKYQRRLGCPIGETVGGEFAEQIFENGFMVWTGIYAEIYAMVGSQTGAWSWYDKKTIDSFGPSDSGSCSVRVPEGLFQPVRGFGAVWCGDREMASTIGFGLTPEYGVSSNLIQKYETGVIIRDSQKRYWVLFSNSATYALER